MHSLLRSFIFCTLLFAKFERLDAYEDFCDNAFNEMYCSCDVGYAQTTMACFIQVDLETDHERWKDMASVENVVILKLSSNLNRSRFTKIPTNSLKSMPYLETLEIQHANLTELDSYAISDLKVLRELKLENCDISKLQPNAISNLARLKKLSMSDNLIEEVTADSLTGLLSLENLFLERNRIFRIESCAFCDLQELRELSLFENKIQDLSEYMFRGIRLLTRLELFSNKIRILNDKVFHSLPNLSDLDLHDNLIYHIGPRAFYGLEKLRMLNLKSNKIKRLPETVFASLPSLRSVELDKNELITLQEQVLSNINKVKDPHFYFHVKNNTFVCDCRLAWVKTYIHRNYSNYFIKELKQLHCTTDDEKRTVKLVHKLKMDCTEFLERQKSTTTTPRPTVQSSDLIPYEIQKLKNKATLSDAAVENDIVDITQDSNVVDEKTNAGPSNSKALVADFNLILLVTLLTLFFVRKRKGTCF